MYAYTQRGTNVLGLIFFKNRREITFFTQNKLRWYIRVYRLLRGRTIAEKLPKISLFGLL
jgi:hypothetical protein